MRIFRDETAQTLILVALALPCLLEFVGLAVDVGVLLNAKRQLQSAADAAAIAGALNLNYMAGSTDTNDSSNPVTVAAYAASTQNGFTNGQNHVTVTVEDPPTWPGSNYKAAGYVEATVSKVESTIFMSLFGFPSVTVAARAVASNGGPGTGCIYTLQTSGTGFLIDGNVSLTAPECGLIVDSDMVLKGKAADLSLASIGVAGSYSGAGPPVVNPAPVTGVVPYSDPLSYLPQYSCTTTTTGKGKNQTTTGSCSCAIGSDCTNSPVAMPVGNVPSVTISGTMTLSPGTFLGLSFPNGTNVTLNPGLYIVDGDLSFGSGTVTGNGVTFYYTGALSMGSGTYNITAPNDSTQLFNGVLIDQSNTDPNTSLTITGNGSSVFKGIVYAPTVDLTMKGTPDMAIYAAYVVHSIDLRGDVTFNSYAALSGIANPLSSIRLVE